MGYLQSSRFTPKISMEILANLSKTTVKQLRRVGRGYGSKKGGHTTGRGAKGDKVRGKTRITFDGTKIKKGWIKRLPFLRGKNRLNSIKSVSIINLADLEKWFKAGDKVTRETLVKTSLIKDADYKKTIKILGQGKLTKALTIKNLVLTETAKAQIVSAGGKIEA